MERGAQKLSFYIERATTEQLAELARRGDRTLSAEIRRACREHVEVAGVPLRQASPDEHRGRSAAPTPAAAPGEDAA